MRSPLALLIALAAVSVACDYDAPPEVSLDLPESEKAGVYGFDEPLRLLFTEPVRADTLALRIWPQERDVEGRIAAGTTPLVDLCRAGDAGCGETTITFAKGDESAEVLLASGSLRRPGGRVVLEVLPGLSDRGGSATGRSYEFDVQFLTPPPPVEPPTEVVPFEEGYYVIVGTLDRPIPAVLTYITNVRALPDGSVALVGAEGDEIDGAPKNTIIPEELFVDASSDGYTVYATGRITMQDGRRYLHTESFGIDVVSGGIGVILEGVILEGEITKVDGHDHIEGSFLFEKATVVIGATRGEFEGGSTPLVGVWAPPGTCEEGAPEVCGDLCGWVINGQCSPPEGFPPAEFCGGDGT